MLKNNGVNNIMLSKKYLHELMLYHEEKEAREAKALAESNAAKAALGKFIKEKNKNTLGEQDKIKFLM